MAPTNMGASVQSGYTTLMDGLDFPDLVVSCSAEALVLCSQSPLEVLSSAVVGGGFVQARYLLNRHVHRDYYCMDPVLDLMTFARSRGITETFVGHMTAVPVHKAQAATLCHDGLTVAVVITAGVANATAPGLSPPACSGHGTINVLVFIDARLTPAAMVNAVMTATEAKTQTLMTRDTRTPEGYSATGTSTDAIAVATTGRGITLPYAGPVTLVGWLIGRCVRTALTAALA